MPIGRALSRAGALTIVHAGHLPEVGGPSPRPEVQIADVLLSHGCDVLAMDMPMIGRNHRAGTPWSHEKIADRISGSARTKKWKALRLFVEPVFLAVDWALGQGGYESVRFVGHSGGSWTGTLAGAIDKRIARVHGIAGGGPFAEPKPLHVELNPEHPLYILCPYLCQFALAALHAEIVVAQLHERDSVTPARGRHDEIRAFERRVLAAAPAVNFVYVVTKCTVHAPLCDDDLAVIEVVDTGKERLDRRPNVTPRRAARPPAAAQCPDAPQTPRVPSGTSQWPPDSGHPAPALPP